MNSYAHTPQRALACLILVLIATEPASAADVAIDFARDIQPIFSKHCTECHGPKKRKGGVRLDLKSAALTGGDSGPLFVSGKSGESHLIKLVSSKNPEERMPSKGDPLSAAQIALLRTWIDAGATWPDDGPAKAASTDHWSFKRPAQPAFPAVKNPKWIRNPVDAFVLSKMEEQGLAPSPEADRLTLIRRLSLDLTGLPPSIKEADAFAADTSADAYDRLVETLLKSPHYGERWGRHWLDGARYADTNGYEKDLPRSIWPYRDWVIKSINADMPFDQFSIEQIAGDMLPNATLDQKIATGFHRNTMINEEGGVDVEEFRYESLVDRVKTTSTVWLGLTVGCAQCHTHKYDAITQREYFQMFAFLNNADEPEIDVTSLDTTRRREEQEKKIAQFEASLAGALSAKSPTPALTEKIEQWEKAIAPKCADWTVLDPVKFVSRKNATMTKLDDKSILAGGDIPNNDVYDIEFQTDLQNITAFRLEVLLHPSLPDGGPGRGVMFSRGDFLLTEVEARAGVDAQSMKPIALQNGTESFAPKDRSAARTIDGVIDTGWAVTGRQNQAHQAVFEFKQPLGAAGGTRLSITLHQFYIHQQTIGRFRISITTAPQPVKASGLTAEIEAIVRTPSQKRSAEQKQKLTRHFLLTTPELSAQQKQIADLRKGMPRNPTSMIMEERKAEHARKTFIHHRGEFLSLKGEVEPGVLEVLHPLPKDAPRNRLTFARWLVDKESPLVGRVVMNRLWYSYFGKGLVGSLEDFGVQGDKPTHPQLLDFLATELTAGAAPWSMKAMHRLIVSSATYRQSSRVPPALLARDPSNEFLARGARFRVEAEIVRDIALSASGLLSPKIGGPSVFPPQPDGVMSVAYGDVKWHVSTGADRYRRGLYTYFKRTAPYASFMMFDAPNADLCCVRRNRTNTPLSALTLLNDEVFVEASRAIALRLVTQESKETQQRARLLFRLCITRAPEAKELEHALAFYQKQLERFRGGNANAATIALAKGAATPAGVEINELAAWTLVARAILNLDETITRD